ncbi:unnamed protein product [Urochloa humidicola]
MLEVSILRSPSKADQRGFVGDHGGLFPGGAGDCDEFMVGVDGNLLELEYMEDFISCCDVPFFDADGDILPDLEVDPTELLAEFSSPETSPAAAEDDGGRPPDLEQQQVATVVGEEDHHQEAAAEINNKQRVVLLEKDDKKAAAGATANNKKGDEGSSAVTTEQEDSDDIKSSAGGHGKKKACKDSNGKRKVKVDWTPDLHRRFVQAVEQLGIDKAVPSRILEIMGIECLTRHNIASHLQKYRSHRKHLMAREAEAATWAQKRHMYAAAAAGAPARKAAAPWVVPTIGFPPPPLCRPLHVWGHPPAAAAAEGGPPPPAMLPVWPRHLAPPRPWAPMMDPAAYWNHQYNAASRKWGPHHPAAVTQGCPMPPPAMVQLPRFPVPPHPTMFRPAMVVPPPAATTTTSKQLAELQLQLDAHPSKESIDAAIGDVLVKPWLPLPLGLKPPSLHSVMAELHKQGIPKVPPPAASSTG